MMIEKDEQHEIPHQTYRPEQYRCPFCRAPLHRSHIGWRKCVIGITGPREITSWVYRCPEPTCANRMQNYISTQAEALHLKHRRFGRDVVVAVGYRRFWQHQTMYELHEWLTQDLTLSISKRQVLNLLGDFLALLRAAQPAKIRTQLPRQERWILSIDGMQPERGNTCLYVVRELQSGLTLLAENLDDSRQQTLSTQLLEPLQTLAAELGITWHGIVSDAQKSLRLAIQHSLPAVPHQTCQFHALRTAGDMTFQADRRMKKQLKKALRRPLARLQRRIAALPPTDLYRPILTDYADATRTTLWVGGVAPFELGGLRVLAALTAVAASLTRCQKKGPIRC